MRAVLAPRRVDVVSTSAYLIVFRIMHIVAAIAWGGSVFLFVVFLQPTAAAIAPAGMPFMRELLANRRLVDRLLWLAIVTIVGGLFLYWHDWHGYASYGDFVSSAFGAVLTIGGVSALVAFVIGLFGTRPKGRRLIALMSAVAEAAQSGNPPPPEVVAEMQGTQDVLKVLARLNLAFIAIAALAMATARYW
jgi:uncharacterized membrane protein